MKDLKNIVILLLAFCLSWTNYAQYQSTNPLKNISDLANDSVMGLEYSFNSNADTLTFKSDVKILRITFLIHENRRSIVVDVNAFEVKIPLHHFKKGRYTFAVYKEDEIVGLRFDQLNDIANPSNTTQDLETSILASSLSSQEQHNTKKALISRTEKRDKKGKRKKKDEVANNKPKSPFDIIADKEKARVATILNRKNSSED